MRGLVEEENVGFGGCAAAVEDEDVGGFAAGGAVGEGEIVGVCGTGLEGGFAGSVGECGSVIVCSIMSGLNKTVVCFVVGRKKAALTFHAAEPLPRSVFFPYRIAHIQRIRCFAVWFDPPIKHRGRHCLQ